MCTLTITCGRLIKLLFDCLHLLYIYIHLSHCFSQGIRLKSDLLAFTNTTVWNSTTSFSYSGNPQKTLTFATTLLNTAAFRDGSNYTMVTSLTQPFSDLDLGFTSSVGGNESKYAGWLEGWFLTSQQRMRRAALKGILHRLERSLLFTVTPFFFILLYFYF